MRARWHTRREHQHADHLYQHANPVRRVVVIEGAGEPCEPHPRPPDGKEHHHEAEHSLTEVTLNEGVMQLLRGQRDRDHEAKVEQQLKSGGRALFLMGITRDHRLEPAKRGVF